MRCYGSKRQVGGEGVKHLHQAAPGAEGMTRSRSIAVAQTCPVAGDVLANLDEHIRLARLAATEGAEVVVFPELSLTGYELALAKDLAFSENDPRMSTLLDLAAANGTTLVVGA